MSRQPIGDRAMTAAERQRRRRARLGIGGPLLRAIRPWDGSPATSRQETNAIDRIEHWVMNGDIDDVTFWFAFLLHARGEVLEDGGAEFSARLGAKLAELSAELLGEAGQ